MCGIRLGRQSVCWEEALLAKNRHYTNNPNCWIQNCFQYENLRRRSLNTPFPASGEAVFNKGKLAVYDPGKTKQYAGKKLRFA